jgi:uncharacterized protein (TIGR02598 family)
MIAHSHCCITTAPGAAPRARAGFSLPEVTMAVGIAAMAIVLLLGLVPSGLNSVRDASIKLAESRIIQQIAGEIQGANWGQQTGSGALAWSNLGIYQDARRFFDDQGTPLAPGAGGVMGIGYVARITINPGNIQPAVPTGLPSPNLVAVQIDVAAVPDPNFEFAPAGADRPLAANYRTHTVLVGRQF